MWLLFTLLVICKKREQVHLARLNLRRNFLTHWPYFLSTLEFLSYPCKRWNSGLIFYTHLNFDHILPDIGILISSLHRELEFCPIFINIRILIYPSKHWKCGPFLYTLVFLSDLSKHWNYDLIDPNIGILALFL